MSFMPRILIAALVACALGSLSTAVAAERLLSGELVVLKGSTDQFRLVGHDGTFKAPAGTGLAELDGKAVDIAVSNGRVTQIVPHPVRALAPVTAQWETVQGQMIVRDPVARSFAFAGDSRVYIASPSLEIAPYGGKWVEATVDTHGQVTSLKLVAAPPPPPVSMPVAPVPPVNMASSAAATCAIGNATVASGSTVCREGVTNRCSNGSWQSLGTACR